MFSNSYLQYKTAPNLHLGQINILNKINIDSDITYIYLSNITYMNLFVHIFVEVVRLSLLVGKKNHLGSE